MEIEEVLKEFSPKMQDIITQIYNLGVNCGYEEGTGMSWKYTKNNEYPPKGVRVICHGTLTTPYGNIPICDKTFIGYYKGAGFGWFIENAVDGESDQSWPVEEWRFLDSPPSKH